MVRSPADATPAVAGSLVVLATPFHARVEKISPQLRQHDDLLAPRLPGRRCATCA
jgi:hypothetical protein